MTASHDAAIQAIRDRLAPAAGGDLDWKDDCRIEYAAACRRYLDDHHERDDVTDDRDEDVL